MRLWWSRRAQQDLERIGAYIAADNPKAARRWIEQLRTRARKAAATPGTGRRVPEYARDDVREVLHRNYRIIYQQTQGSVLVLMVTEGHRLLPAVDELG